MVGDGKAYPRVHGSHGDIELDIPPQRGIYEPAEDTYLLINTIESVTPNLTSSINSRLPLPAVEVGCGSGLVALVLAKTFPTVIATDINRHAVGFLKEESRKRGVKRRMHFIQGDSLTFLRSREAIFSIAVMNPPYLPEDADELELNVQGDEMFDKDPILAALEAPEGGTAVLKTFLDAALPGIHSGGKCIFIISSFTEFEDLPFFLEKKGAKIEREVSIHLFFEDIKCIITRKEMV